jgi:putative FmdB family regulatory protein
MPIYAYRCTACGHAKDVLQKMSDPVLSTCPACGAEAFTKQVTAAGFQLKGSGWYATDFKGSGAAPAAKGAVSAEGSDGSAATGATSDGKSDGKSDAKPESKAEPKPETKAASPSAPASSPPAGGAAAGH